jgi:hypothetical protein
MDEDILRFDIAMDDVRLVKVLDRLGNFFDVLLHLLLRQAVGFVLPH